MLRPDIADQGPSIELWLVDCDACAPALALIEHDVPRLTADDRARARAIGDPAERRRRLAAYTALRMLLERIAGAGMRGRPIARAPGSRPMLSGGGAEFSLSHTAAHALIAVSRDRLLGVDLERVRPAKMSARRRAEIVALGAGLGTRPLPSLDAERTLLQAWTRLEAFAKARGAGLARTLADAGLRGGKGRPPPPPDQVEAAGRRLAGDAGLAVHDVRLPPRFHGAIAASRGTRIGRLRQFPAQRAAIERLLAQPA